MNQTDARSAYEIEPRNKFLSAIASISAFELQRPGNTVTFLSEVDLTEVEQVRARAAQEGQRKPSYTAFVVKAVALALCEFPFANRRMLRWSWFGPRVQKFNRIDAAVLCERELPEAPMVAFVDMIRHADRASLTDITDQLHCLATCDETNNEQWRSFKTIIQRLPRWLAGWVLRMPVLSPRLWVRYRGGAFAVSSPAKYGVDVITAIWPWPLGFSFGLVRPRPMVVEGQLAVRPGFVLTLNFDRRLMAGAQAARFFKRITDILERANETMTPFLPVGNSTLQGSPPQVEEPATR